MRKYQGILFAALFCFVMLLLLAAGLWWYRPRRAEPVPGRVYESERMPENNAVLNPEPEVAEKQSGYCLTAEDGMLLIFDGTSGEVCFQTHMPLSEFSVEEQEKLLEGVCCVIKAFISCWKSSAFTIWSLSAVRCDYNTVKKQRIKSAYERYEANGQEGK